MISSPDDGIVEKSRLLGREAAILDQGVAFLMNRNRQHHDLFDRPLKEEQAGRNGGSWPFFFSEAIWLILEGPAFKRALPEDTMFTMSTTFTGLEEVR